MRTKTVRLALVAALALGLFATGGAALATQPLTAFVALRGEETGFSPQGRPTVYSKLHDLLVHGFSDTPAQLKVDAPRLRREGFVAGAIEHTSYNAAPSRGAGASDVLELGSATAARREQAAVVQQLVVSQRTPVPGQPKLVTHRFTVPGVPSAEGITGTPTGLAGGQANAFFIEGRCMLFVGDSLASGNTTQPVTSAVESIYRRTRGRCP